MDLPPRITLGWCPDVPDFRDRVVSSPQLTSQRSVDLREERLEPTIDVPVGGQQVHATCASALLWMLDWQKKKWTGRQVDASISFLHSLTVRIMGGGGIQGVGIRSTIQTLLQFGAPPEYLWPSIDGKFHPPSSPELYRYDRAYQNLNYFRLDGWQFDRATRIAAMKHQLCCGEPFLIGFSVPTSVVRTNQRLIAFDPLLGSLLGGSAAVVMGFDDDFRLPNPLNFQSIDRAHQKRGAFLIKTCWGSSWGDNGYGWLPYAFVDTRFASDAWAIMDPAWL